MAAITRSPSIRSLLALQTGREPHAAAIGVEQRQSGLRPPAARRIHRALDPHGPGVCLSRIRSNDGGLHRRMPSSALRKLVALQSATSTASAQLAPNPSRLPGGPNSRVAAGAPPSSSRPRPIRRP